MSMAGYQLGLLNICVVFLISSTILIQTCNAQWTHEEDICQTPDFETGTCIAIYSCQPLMDILDKAPKPLNSKLITLLRSYTCGFEGKDPKVCCPSKPIITELITNVEELSGPLPPDVTKHRNIRLLPKECGSLDTGDRIINGNRTALFEFPWMALLSYNTQRGPQFKCGGTIINNKYILTAAHCIKDTALLGVRVGDHDVSKRNDCEKDETGEEYCSPPFKDLAVEKILPHPNYDKKTHSNDIGLLRVTEMNIDQENIRPVCLPLDKTGNYNYTGRNTVVTGWGATETGRPSNVLLKVFLPVMEQSKCIQIYKNITKITHLQICAGGTSKSDSCAGDSGGPLHVIATLHGDSRQIQQGVVSFGPRDCGRQGLPGVYTRVAYYLDWILDNLKP